MTLTAVESCRCGATFFTDTFSIRARAQELADFREAHRVCREQPLMAIGVDLVDRSEEKLGRISEAARDA